MDRFEVTIEITDAELPAWRWADAYYDVVAEAAFASGALEARRDRRTWGMVLELAFADEDAWLDFLRLPVVRAALDAVPDRIAGVVMHRGWGGAGGRWARRRPRPKLGSGAAAVLLPVPDETIEVFGRHITVVAGADVVDLAPRRAG
jgi:hypothetical protein